MESSSSSSASPEADAFDLFFERDVSDDEEWLRDALRQTRIKRSHCLQPPRSQLIILCHVERFFTLCHPLSHAETVEALKRYVKHLCLGERIGNFYQRGYPADTRPCDEHPQDVRELLCTCFAIVSFCRDIVVDYFLSLHPPVLFYYTVMVHGSSVTERDLYALQKNYTLDEYKIFLEHRVYYIVKEGLVDLIDHMIEKKIPIHPGMLEVAAQHSQIDVFDRLACLPDARGLNEAPDYRKAASVMHHVIMKENEDMFDRLIMHGFDINFRHEYITLGYPLEYSFFCGDAHFATRLLDYGSKVDFMPFCGITLLNLAIVNEFPAPLIERLIAMGLDPRTEDKVYGNTQDVIDNLLNGDLRPGSITYTNYGRRTDDLHRKRGEKYNDRVNLFATMEVIKNLCGEIPLTERGRKRLLLEDGDMSLVATYHHDERRLRHPRRDSMMEEMQAEYTGYVAGENYTSVQQRLVFRLGGEPFDGYYSGEEIMQRMESYYPTGGISNESGSRIALTQDFIDRARLYHYDDFGRDGYEDYEVRDVEDYEDDDEVA